MTYLAYDPRRILKCDLINLSRGNTSSPHRIPDPIHILNALYAGRQRIRLKAVKIRSEGNRILPGFPDHPRRMSCDIIQIRSAPFT